MDKNVFLQESEKKLKDLYNELTAGFEKRMKSDALRTNIFFLCVFVAFAGVVGLSLFFIDGSLIAEMRNVEESTAKNTDYLELALPAMITVVLFFIAFLGVNRLRDMDAQVEQIRNSIGDALDKEVRRLETLRNDLEARIDSTLDNKTTTMTTNLKTKVDESLEEIRKAGENSVTEICGVAKNSVEEICEVRKNSLEQLQKASDKSEERRVYFDERYSWLANLEPKVGDEILNDVASVSDVHDAIQTLWNLPQKPRNIRELTTRYVELVVAEDSTIYGTKNDYHNVAAECGRRRLYDLAVRICEKGLVVFPNEFDLLADLIMYASSLGQYETPARSLSQLQTIDKNLWNWRAFEFSIDYFKQVGKYEEAEQLADEYIKFLPFDERAYFAKAEICLLRYSGGVGTNKAIKALQVALEHNLNCPMCARKLGELLAEGGELEAALVVYNRAFMEHAQEQPNCHLGFIAFERALIYDRLAHKTQTEGRDEAEANRLATCAAKDYEFAEIWLNGSDLYRDQIQQRLLTLRNYFQLNAKTDDGDKEKMLQHLMSLMQNEQNDDESDEEEMQA